MRMDDSRRRGVDGSCHLHFKPVLRKNHHMSSGVVQDIWPCGTKELTTELSLEGDNSLMNENQDTQPDNETLN